MNDSKTLIHNGQTILIENFEIAGVMRWQCFLGDTGIALSEIEYKKSIAIMNAIESVNTMD